MKNEKIKIIGRAKYINYFVGDLYHKLVCGLVEDDPASFAFFIQEERRKIHAGTGRKQIADGLIYDENDYSDFYRINAKNIEVNNKKYDLEIVASENFPCLMKQMDKEKYDLCICDFIEIGGGTYFTDYAKEKEIKVVNVHEGNATNDLMKKLKENYRDKTNEAKPK